MERFPDCPFEYWETQFEPESIVDSFYELTKTIEDKQDRAIRYIVGEDVLARAQEMLEVRHKLKAIEQNFIHEELNSRDRVDFIRSRRNENTEEDLDIVTFNNLPERIRKSVYRASGSAAGFSICGIEPEDGLVLLKPTFLNQTSTQRNSTSMLSCRVKNNELLLQAHKPQMGFGGTNPAAAEVPPVGVTDVMAMLDNVSECYDQLLSTAPPPDISRFDKLTDNESHNVYSSRHEF